MVFHNHVLMEQELKPVAHAGNQALSPGVSDDPFGTQQLSLRICDRKPPMLRQESVAGKPPGF